MPRNRLPHSFRGPLRSNGEIVDIIVEPVLELDTLGTEPPIDPVNREASGKRTGACEEDVTMDSSDHDGPSPELTRAEAE